MADVKLLPLPEYLRADYKHMDKDSHEAECKHYARANVEASSKYYRDMLCQSQDDVMKLSTETEALRAEVRELKADRDSWEQQASDRVADWHDEHKRAERLDAELHDCQAALLIADAKAERLAEALRNAREYAVIQLNREREASTVYGHCSEIASIEGDLADIDSLLREQEGS